MNTKVQNQEAKVENLVEQVKNETVINATVEIFEEILNLENLKHLAEIITTEIAAELMHASFMTEQLELTEKQKEKLGTSIEMIVDKSKNTYIAGINKEDRTKEQATTINYALHKVLEQMLSGIGQEVNRGALINCVAVAADTKLKDHNKIELNHSKHAGDVTIPTRGLFISTNCIDVIEKSINDPLQPIIDQLDQF